MLSAEDREILTSFRYLVCICNFIQFIMHYDVLLIVFQKEQKKGYLHWKKKDLERALKSSRNGFSFTTRPYFVETITYFTHFLCENIQFVAKCFPCSSVCTHTILLIIDY